MKYIILPLVLLFALMSCEEENVQPFDYSGRYSFTSDEVEFAFDLFRDHSIYKGGDGRVTHSAISSTEGRNNIVVTYNRTVAGFEIIKIRSLTPVTWSVELIGAEFINQGMRVSEIRIMMPEMEAIVLTDRVLERR